MGKFTERGFKSNQFHVERKYSRWRARQKFLETLSSPFSQCTYCNQDLFWREKAQDVNIEIVWKTRKTVWIRRSDGFTTKAYRYGTVDHIIPLSQNGTNQIENLAGSCESCNLAKGRREAPTPVSGNPCSHCGRFAVSMATKVCSKCGRENRAKATELQPTS